MNLSSVVFNERNAAAAAVAAYEVGHAVQYARGYTWLQMRSKLVPIVSLSSRIVQFVIIGGILLVNVFPGLLLGGIILFSLTTLFAFITLPVEYDASKDALKWAARTYVVSAIGSLATLLYYLAIYMRRR